MTRRRTRFDATRERSNRRSGTIPGRLFALAAVLAAVAPCLCAGGASADTGSSLGVTANVFAANGARSTSSVTVAGLEAQVAQCPWYTGGSYVSGDTFPKWTWTLATVLGCLSPALDLNSVTAVVVLKPDGTAEQELSPAELQAGPGSADASTPPVVFDDGSNLQYYDGVAGDHVETQQFTVDAYEGPPLDVRIVPSQTTVPQGGSVSFTADVANGPASQYGWSFDGAAADSSQSTPTVQFQQAGNYTVSVEVSNPASGSGGSATTQIDVTASAPPPSTTTGTKPNTSQGTNTSSSAPSHGAARGEILGGGVSDSRARRSSAHRSRERHSSAAGGNAPGEGSRRSSTRHTSGSGVPTSGDGPGDGGAGTPGKSTHSATSSSAFAGGRSVTASSSTLTPTRAATVRPTRPAALTAPLVRGRLISDVTLLSAGAGRSAHTAASGTLPVMRRGVRASRLPLIGALLAAALLLALGAASELRAQRGARSLRLRS